MSIISSIGTFIAEHPRLTLAAKVAIPVVAVGALIAACSDGGTNPARRGAELINQFDKNGDGELNIATEGVREVARSEVYCPFPRDVNGDGVTGPNECDFPQSRAWIETRSIQPLLRTADTDHNTQVTSSELEHVIMSYDTRGAKRGEPADGRIQNSEYRRFVSDWGELVVRSTRNR